MRCAVDVPVRFSLRGQGRILMETVVVGTRTLCVAIRAKRGGTDGNADYETAFATRDDIPGIVDLQELRLVFRIEHGCGPRQMEKMRSIQ
jgi:hypothetical protein